MGESTKVQLGARVSALAKQIAVDNAKQAGLSLNAYIERLILRTRAVAAGSEIGLPEAAREEARAQAQAHLSLNLDPPERPAGPVRDSDIAHPPAEPKFPIPEAARTERVTFDPNCTNGVNHWRHGPSYPCRFCRGTVEP